jgi:hypothetical protein
MAAIYVARSDHEVRQDVKHGADNPIDKINDPSQKFETQIHQLLA